MVDTISVVAFIEHRPRVVSQPWRYTYGVCVVLGIVVDHTEWIFSPVGTHYVNLAITRQTQCIPNLGV